MAKRKSRHSYAQDEINRLLVGLAREGLTVVRLKGGDPFVFGRGGEELEACRAAGVDCDVVPGVTAALAAAAAAGAPLTHRGLAQAVTFVTGHAARRRRAPDLDWAVLARANQTVVIYMGLSTAAVIAARLIAAGRAASTPALIVENASLPDERRVADHPRSTSARRPRGLDGPALLIVGEVAALADASAPAPVRQSAAARSAARSAAMKALTANRLDRRRGGVLARRRAGSSGSREARAVRRRRAGRGGRGRTPRPRSPCWSTPI